MMRVRRVDKYISAEKGGALASSVNVRFMETSARTGANVEAVFQSITQDLMQQR